MPRHEPGDQTTTDARLGPLADNGGPTWTRALLQDSPALDAIPYGVNGCGTTYTQDQRGLFPPGARATARVDLYLLKTVNSPSAIAGDPITYTLTFRNAGMEPASGVVITDVVPLSVTVAASSTVASPSPTPAPAPATSGRCKT